MTRDKWASREIQHRMEDGIIVSCSDGRGARGKARRALRGQAGRGREETDADVTQVAAAGGHQQQRQLNLNESCC
jgi:hypothetical protein